MLGDMLTPRQKFLLLNSLMLCMFISALDQSIVATATPRILADLGGFDLLSWVFTVYLLASTVVVPVVGKLSDMFGRKPFILAGIAIFVTASAACGAAPSMPFLIAARAVQGIGGGMVFACVFATIGDLFTPLERAKYMGYFIGAFTLASLSGPTIGGFLTDGPGWRWCFYINLPVGALASVFIWRNLPVTRNGGFLGDVDFLGAGLLSGSTISLLLGLEWASKAYGWASVPTVGLFVVAAIFAVAFVLQERRHKNAIFPVDMFRNRVFVQANVLVAIQGAAIFGAVQYLPTFIQTALGASATASGLVSTPQSLGLLATSIVGGQLVSRTGKFKYQVIFGACLIALAAFLLHGLDSDEPKWHIAAFMVVSGLGSGFVGPTISVIVQSAVPREQIGIATSSRQFFMQIGQVVGVAVMGLVFSTTYSSSFETTLPVSARESLSASSYDAFLDPTLQLDERRYASVEQEVLGEDGGTAVLAAALGAQKSAVTNATDNIFLVALIGALVVIGLAVTLEEITLRGKDSDQGRGEGHIPTFEPAVEM